MTKVPNNQIGVAGEYFVAAELSRRGHIASVTLKNTRGIDVLVTDAGARKYIGVQVKTNATSAKEWMLNKKAEDQDASDLFYVFVNLKKEEERPDFYIVPGKIVAEQIKSSHQEWLETPGKNGEPHKDTSIRAFRVENDEYRERWEFLG